MWQRRPKEALPIHSTHEILNDTAPHFGHPLSGERSVSAVGQADEICAGRFTFLNQTLSFPVVQPDWQASPDGDLLWTYNLHYFEYAYDLYWAYCATDKEHYLQRLLELMLLWINENPFWTRTAWNAYPLSKRLIAWTTLVGHLHRHPAVDHQQLDVIVSSLCQQAAFLAQNVEYDVDNNHLITNARALVWSGIHLVGHSQSAKWYHKGLAILLRESKRQILADGGHWERSTSYQAVVLQDFLETVVLLRNVDRDANAANELLATVNRMFDFLLNLIRPDGKLPLLNDSVEGYPLDFVDLFATGALMFARADLKWASTSSTGSYVEWLFGVEGLASYRSLAFDSPSLASVSMPDSGYHVLRTKLMERTLYLCFDCGPIGPTHSSAHAHADTLSFELSLGAQPLLIDPGTYEYRSGPWRDYFRSTYAHNTVTVDNLDQSSFWGSFRVATMANARFLYWDGEVETVDLIGEHDGYQRLSSSVIHRRKIRYIGPDQIIIEDTLESDGSQSHQYHLSFHLAPSVCSLDASSGICTAIFSNNISLEFLPEHPSGMIAELHSGWYARFWKRKEPIPVLRYAFTSAESVVVFRTTLRIAINE